MVSYLYWADGDSSDGGQIRFFGFLISSVRIWNLQLLEVCSGSRTWLQWPAQLTCATAGERRQEGNYRRFWKMAARPPTAPVLQGFNWTYPVSYENTESSNKWNRCMQSTIRKQPTDPSANLKILCNSSSKILSSCFSVWKLDFSKHSVFM